MRQNILIFCHGYATQFIDINNQYTQLFDVDKYDVTVAYLVGKRDEKIKDRHLAKNIIFLNASKKETRGFKICTIQTMMKLQREKHFQIVICHRYKPTYIMLWVSRFYTIPVLVSIMHELKTMQSLTRKLCVFALAKKNLVLAGVSNTVRDDLRQTVWGVPKNRIITLYNMLDIKTIEPQLIERETARQLLHLSSDDFVFGTIGRLVKAKDQQTLIYAFADIKPTCPNAKLLIIGDGVLESELKEHIKKLHLSQDIVMVGFLDKAFQYMKALDVFVLPSIKEAFGRVLLEAMIAKIPIIAANTHGIPEVIGQSGRLFPAKNKDVLAKEMLTLYQQPKDTLSQQVALGHQRVIELFSFQYFNQLFWELPLLSRKEST